MKILDLKVMKGPNYWSAKRHKLIVMLLDIEDLEQKPTNKIPGFLERLEKMLPTLYSHRCSEEVEGGFFKRVKEGTWMGHVIEHIALELQTLAGMDTGFGRTRSAGKEGVYHVVFSYVEEEVGKATAYAAVEISKRLIEGSDFDIESFIQELREIREKVRLGPSTGSIVQEAINRNIPWIRLNKNSLVQLGYGMNQRRIQATVASTTSNIAVEIACDKEDTKNLLEAAEVPVPRGRIIYDLEDLENTIKKIGYPIVLKPINGNHGRGATTNIKDWESALIAFDIAKKHSRAIICEKFITGFDFRLLVINYKFICAAKRTPACVTGDGTSTIQELIDQVNSDPRRGFGHEKVLTQIKVDAVTEKILVDKNYTLETVLPKGEWLMLKPTANLSTGGTSTDITDFVHPNNIFLAERIARIIGLDICGIDIMASDLSTPLEENGGAVLEVNAAPGFRMHIEPSEGLPRNVAEPVIDMLYPAGTSARIPIIAISGTNGKTTTTRLTAHIVKNMGYKVGFTTSDGVYIQNQLMMRGDCTGPISAEFVLKDPTVDFAVMECARGGILRAGLGFHKCDIGIVTNISADHLGLGGIDTVEQLARVKEVVVQSVSHDGYAILNADDDLVYKMRNNLDCKIALFSTKPNSKRIKDHCEKNGIAAIYDEQSDWIYIQKGAWKIQIEKALSIPLTQGGKATFNVLNIMPSVLAAYLRGFTVVDIRQALHTFIPSPAQTPGRMNLFQFKNFQVLADYAHNPAGFNVLKAYVDKVTATKKIGIIAGTGDRRDDDIKELGMIAASMFDEIIIRQDKHLRGRTVENIVELLLEGIHQMNKKIKVHVILKELDAIDFAIKNAPKDSFIAICSDVVTDALAYIQNLKGEEDKQ
ncbi:MAG: cyanophycin synthetase [Chitinophagaceae bacterium]|nr:MAG: cyanophycin synthetase [Bacteroidetes bacterium OLB11]MCC6447667.1 cyanophycin synthetase [Chitinophagaceae bacterium]HMN32600.1 cyanophycin synthetase [Chitinophagaceae bacterium]